MRTCSYCGHENEEARTQCHECGTGLRREPETPSDRSVSKRRLRIALGVIGVGGGLLWFCLGVLILLFSGWKPGGPQGGMSDGEWALCIATILITFIYYAVVSGSVWSRGLLLAGIAIHVLWAAAVVCIAALSDGGFIFAPLFFTGAACWIAYAMITPRANVT
jgi:hypothetical protein